MIQETWAGFTEYLMDPANVMLFVTIGVVMVREVTFGLLRKQLGIKETQAEDIRVELIHINEEEQKLSENQRVLAESILALGDMVNTAYQNSKLSPEAKAEIDKTWGTVVGTLARTTMDLAPQIPNKIEEALDKILPTSEDQPLLNAVREQVGTLVQNAVDDQIQRLPEHVDNLSRILGSK
jgi:hypothetical protein